MQQASVDKGSNNRAISLPTAKRCLENSFSKEKVFWNRKNVSILAMKEHFNEPEPIPVIGNFLHLWVMSESVLFVWWLYFGLGFFLFAFFFMILIWAMQIFKGRNENNVAIDSFKMLQESKLQ